MGISEKTTDDNIERDLIPAATASAIEDAAAAVTAQHRIIRFRGNPMIKVRKPYEHFVPLDKETFERVAYPLVSGMSRSRMNDTFAYLCSTADDLSDNDRYILFGAGSGCQAVWDMERLEIRSDIFPDDCVWRSPYALVPTDGKPIPFIMNLANGSQDVYDDIMQSLAPLIMARKPDGVIWWVGDDMSSKSTLTEALYQIFPDQLSDLTVGQLNGGRRTLGLNKVLGNIAEDSDSQINDTEIYKHIGAHQNFSVHRYHSQSSIEVWGNVHHIFSSNSAPKFYTRSLSVDRRTHVMQFSNRLDSNQAYTPTDEFFGQLIAEMCKYAVHIKQQGHRYKWSGVGIKSKKPAPALSPALSQFNW